MRPRISLKNVVLPSGFTTLGSRAFDNCQNLESIVLPASLMNYNGGYSYETFTNIFSGCEKLTKITANSKIPLAIDENIFDPMTYVKATLYVPVGAVDAYKSAEGWKNFFNIVEDPSINDNIVGIVINRAYNGTVYIQSPKDTYAIGDEITIVFEPSSEEYEVSEVLVNGVNMVSKVVDNKLTFTLESNTIISAEFSWHYVEPVDHYISIKQGEMGCVKMKGERWKEYSFLIEPEKDYKIHSVTYNGEDITDSVIDNNGYLYLYGINEDVIINIAFESKSDGNVSIETNPIRVLGENDAIRIVGYAEGETVAICNLNGQLIANQTLAGYETVVPVTSGQVYILRFKDKVVKIAI